MDFRLAYERFCRKEKLNNKKIGIISTNAYLSRRWSGVKEVHHILPKTLGGRNIASNFVAVSHDQHIYAHMLLNLAFLQEGNTKALALLNYASVNLPMDFIMKQRAMRSIKISIPLEGKKRDPIVMGIFEAAKYFCFASHKNFNDKKVLNKIASQLLRNATFGMPWFGMKLGIVFDGKVENVNEGCCCPSCSAQPKVNVA